MSIRKTTKKIRKSIIPEKL